MLMNLLLVLLLPASVLSESQVRETETWVPMKATQAVAVATHRGDLESSGDSTNGSDFGFTDEEDRRNYDDGFSYDDEDDDDDDDEEDRPGFNYDNYDNGDIYDEEYDDHDDYDDYEYSGSGDRESTESPAADRRPSAQPDLSDNKIPELAGPVRPTVNEVEEVRNRNEIPLLRQEEEEEEEELLSNVLMSHHGDQSLFSRTEVLAALIAGGAVCVVLAVLLILLLVYRMKKKDEGSYDLGKKPIYKKAPTTEIYA